MPTDSRPPSAFSSIPPVVKNLLILNGLAFLAQAVFDWLPAGQIGAPGPLMWWGALWPIGGAEAGASVGEVAPAFYPWQLVTMAFLHGGFLHIAFNMFALFSLGAAVEQALGTRRFIGLYAASVLGASLLQLAVVSAPFLAGTITAGSIFPTVGASGGVLGVATAFGILNPRQSIFIFPLPVPIEARWLVPGFAVLSLVLGITGAMGGVAHFAHLGGMVAGALLVLFWRQRARRPA